MKIIKRIKIQSYRSFQNVIIEAEDLNIYSGVNNVGKSNILKALNLFFNSDKFPFVYERDYNKALTGGGVQSVIITVTFYPQKKSTNKALQHEFSLTRVFKKDAKSAEEIFKSTNPEIESKIKKKDGNTLRFLRIFVNKIHFYYIPAIRDRAFTQNFLLNFEQVLKTSTAGNDFNKYVSRISDIITDKSKDLSEEFKKFIGVDTHAKLSSDVDDILGAIDINIDSGIRTYKRGTHKTEAKYVNIYSSGDGILMSYLTYFLAYISKHSTKEISIWGYEEPENSLEYSKTQELAIKFRDQFIKDAQIFITTHSPAFIRLKDSQCVKFYRVYIPQKQEDVDRRLTHVQTLDGLRKERDKQLKLNDYVERKEILQKLDDELYLTEFNNIIGDLSYELKGQDIEILRKAMKEWKTKYEQENKARTKLKQEYNKLLAGYPNKIFICEDKGETVVKLWKILLNDNSITVIPSEGCENDVYETKILPALKHNKPDYNPKIFRVVDRDGLTDRQVQFMEQQYENKYGGRYLYKFLPVCEMENFAVIVDPRFDEALFKKNQPKLILAMNRSLDHRMRSLNKKYNKPNLFTSNINSSSIDSIITAAMKDWKRFVNGKEIVKLQNGYHFDVYIKENIAPELNALVKEIKDFLNSD